MSQNYARLVLDKAGEFAGRTAIVTSQRELSYRELRDTALAFAVRFSRHGVGRGSLVALDVKRPALATASILAVALLGGAWMRVSRSALQNPATRPSHLFHDGRNDGHGARAVEITSDWLDTSHAASIGLAAFPGEASPEAPAIVASSSGTTGAPKYMAISYDVAWKRMLSPKGYGNPAREIAAHMFPADAGGAALINLRVLAEGGTLVHLVGYKNWCAHGVNQVNGSPFQFVDALKGEPIPAAPRIAQAWVRGSKISKGFIATMLKYFETIVVGYGGNEMSGVFHRTIRSVDDDPNNLGRPLPHASVEIVDDQDRPVPPGTEGNMRIRTTTQLASYLGDPEASAEAFRNGWFYPGDLGMITESGEFWIVGRSNDQFNIGGVKINAARIDEVVASHPSVSECVSYCEKDEHEIDRVAVAVTVSGHPDTAAVAKEIRDLCRAQLGRELVPQWIHVVDRLERNESGKPVRLAVQEFVRRNRIPQL